MTVEVIAFPAGIYPSVQRLVPDRGPGQSMSESPFIGSQNVTTYRGSERWRLDMTFDDLTGEDRAEMMAWVTRLRISHNVFLCVQHTAPQRGSLGGTPRAVGSLSGAHLNIYGATASQNSWACAGDFVSVNSQLKMVVVGGATNGSGVASLQVWPPFYDVPNCGTLVVVSSPCGGWRMLDVAAITTNPPGYRSSISIAAIERINSAMVSDFI